MAPETPGLLRPSWLFDMCVFVSKELMGKENRRSAILIQYCTSWRFPMRALETVCSLSVSSSMPAIFGSRLEGPLSALRDRIS